MVKYVPESRLHALAEVDRQWISSLKWEIQALEFDQAKVIHAMLTGSELSIMGKPVRIEVTWPEGRPHGLTDEQIAACFPLREFPTPST